VAWKDDIRPQFRSDTDNILDQTAIFQSSLVRDSGPNVSATIDNLDNLTVDAVSSLKELAAPWFSDQILPFDITLAGTNEMGAATAMRIYGVEILNEGSGVSIDDAVTEMQATFVARYLDPWMAVASAFDLGAGGDSVKPWFPLRPISIALARAPDSSPCLEIPLQIPAVACAYATPSV
jgi:hypothetical protein